MSSQGFTGELPIANVDRVRRIETIQAAVPYAWYGGKYKDEPQMTFAQFATDPKAVFDVWAEFEIAPDQLRDWQRNRQGCVADRRLATQRGWQIGERIPLVSEFLQFPLDLELCGTFDSPTNTGSIWFHWEYLNEGLRQAGAEGVDNSGTIFAKVASSSDPSLVSQQVDDRFASSETPTKTVTEQAFARIFVDMLGNIRVFIRNIGFAVAFSLTLVTANAMAMSMRERTTEVAVLKAIGFTRAHVLWLVLGEASSVALLGGVFGIGFGCLCIQGLHGVNPQFFPLGMIDMAGPWLAYLFATAAGVGLASGIGPAVRSAQLSVIDGLRQV